MVAETTKKQTEEVRKTERKREEEAAVLIRFKPEIKRSLRGFDSTKLLGK